MRPVSESDTSQYLRQAGRQIREMTGDGPKTEEFGMEDQKTTGAPQGGEKTFTQSELDAVVAQRLDRERAKFSDYDALKEKAAKFDKAEEAAKSELQKAQELAADYKAKLDARDKEIAAAKARGKVASETGVPEHLLVGETEEACKAYAEKLLAWRGGAMNVPNKSVDHLLGGKPGAAKTDTDAAFAALRDGLFQKT